MPAKTRNLRKEQRGKMDNIQMQDVIKERNPAEGRKEIYYATLKVFTICKKEEHGPQRHQQIHQ